MANAILVALRLEGALQSWGDHAKWNIRDSGDFPSKSGIVGLLACAMGLERSDPEIVALSNNIQIAVRADRPGIRMIDFHTVQGRTLEWWSGKEKFGIYTANGIMSKDAILSKRWYLQDASFLVLIETDEPWRERICQALKAPKWPIYLGRKSCVPSRPVLDGITTEYEDLLDALRRYPQAERAQETLYYECEIPQDSGASYHRADALLPGERAFTLRQVYRGAIQREVCDVSDKN